MNLSGAAHTQACIYNNSNNNNNNNSNVRFNAIIPAGWGWQFLL